MKKSLLKGAIAGFLKHDHLTLAAALAFYSVLSLAPLLIITLAAIRLFDPLSKSDLIQQTHAVMGPEAAATIVTIIENANQNPSTGNLVGFLGLVFLVFASGAAFSQLQYSLNIIFDARPEGLHGAQNWLRRQLFAAGSALIFGLFIVGTLAVAGTDHSAYFRIPVSFAILTFMFSLMFKFLAISSLDWRSALEGGFVTAILFLIGSGLIGLYLTQGALTSVYGAAGSLVALLAWIYYSALIFFTGAEVTKLLWLGRKRSEMT